MKFTNFCGIFATLFVTTTVVFLVSCSQDDDAYDNSEMYTLAEMGTRLASRDEWNVDPPNNYFLTPGYKEHQVHVIGDDTISLDVVFIISWGTIRAGDHIHITSVTPNNNSEIECYDANHDSISINKYEYLYHTVPHLLHYSSGNLPYNFYYRLEDGYIYYKKAIIDEMTNEFQGWTIESVYVPAEYVDVSDFLVLRPVIQSE